MVKNPTRCPPCTISTDLMFLAVNGSHTMEQYSTVGWIKVLYAISLVLEGQCLRLCLENPVFCLPWMRYFSHAHSSEDHEIDEPEIFSRVNCIEIMTMKLVTVLLLFIIIIIIIIIIMKSSLCHNIKTHVLL